LAGLKLAAKLNRQRVIEKFQDSIDKYREGNNKFPPGEIKAPTQSIAKRTSRRAFASSLLKKEHNR